MRRGALLVLLLAGCSEPAPGQDEAEDPLAALGLVAVEERFSLAGSTLCLPGEGGDDVACETPGGSRVLLGPYDAIITGINVTATWAAQGATTQELVLSVWCHDSGTTDNPSRCDDVDDQALRGRSPLTVTLSGLETPTTAVLEVRLTEPEVALGVPSRTRQAFQVDGVVTYAPEPDATNQA